VDSDNISLHFHPPFFSLLPNNLPELFQCRIVFISGKFTGIIDQSLQNIDQILVVINSYKTQMSDAKRLEIINRAGDQIDKNYNDLLMFNNQNAQLSLNRSKDAADLAAVKKLYGIQ